MRIHADKVTTCFSCPYFGELACSGKLCEGALELIIKQEQEIEQLKAKNKVLGDGVEKAFINGFTDGRKVVDLEKKQAKIDVLMELKDKYGFYSCYSWNNDVKSLNEIVDEMIERLKK